jgi:predicted Zn-dependent peptidase
MIQGELSDGQSFDDALKAIDNEIAEIVAGNFSDHELEKVKNKIESAFEFAKTSILNKAMNLAIYEWIGDAADMNSEVEKYKQISRNDIIRVAKTIFRDNNLSELFYEPSK